MISRHYTSATSVKDIPRWEQDYQLQPVSKLGLFYEYLEMGKKGEMFCHATVSSNQTFWLDQRHSMSADIECNRDGTSHFMYHSTLNNILVFAINSSLAKTSFNIYGKIPSD